MNNQLKARLNFMADTTAHEAANYIAALEAELAEARAKIADLEADYIRRHTDAADRYEALLVIRAAVLVTCPAIRLPGAMTVVDYIDSVLARVQEPRR